MLTQSEYRQKDQHNIPARSRCRASSLYFCKHQNRYSCFWELQSVATQLQNYWCCFRPSQFKFGNVCLLSCVQMKPTISTDEIWSNKSDSLKLYYMAYASETDLVKGWLAGWNDAWNIQAKQGDYFQNMTMGACSLALDWIIKHDLPPQRDDNEHGRLLIHVTSWNRLVAIEQALNNGLIND